MKTSDVDILVVPDRGDAQPDHWQARWERNLKTARRIEQTEWQAPRGSDWADRIFAVARTQIRPTVLVAHGLGVLAVAHAAERLGATAVVGAFLVAPLDSSTAPAGALESGGFWPVPDEAMPWPAVVVASANDPLCSLDTARALSKQWGAAFTDAGPVGHLDIDSGHGPWPEGLLRFGQFLRELG
jgi:uncharacterized protein